MTTHLKTIIASSLLMLTVTSCRKEERSNGELIFRTGRNTDGKSVLDQNASVIKLVQGCQDCHGRNGGNILNRKESIKYKDLTDPSLRDIPYNDSLIVRFLNEELKSDGSTAKTGVVWKMDARDQQDLISFLKSL